jgi:hypothetical protein
MIPKWIKGARLPAPRAANWGSCDDGFWYGRRRYYLGPERYPDFAGFVSVASPLSRGHNLQGT